MIQSFGDVATKDIFDGVNSKRARRKIDPILHEQACRKSDMLNAAVNLNDLKVPPGNSFEQLKGCRKGSYSIRINNQFRIVFMWGSKGPELVEIMDYH